MGFSKLSLHCVRQVSVPLSAAVEPSLHPNLLELPTTAAETGNSLSSLCGTSVVLSPDSTLRLCGEL